MDLYDLAYIWISITEKMSVSMEKWIDLLCETVLGVSRLCYFLFIFWIKCGGISGNVY